MRFLLPHRWFIATAAIGLLVFSFFVTDGTFRFNFPEQFGSFYDYQAASLLHGRLDVPLAGIGAEAFVVQGKSYGYFGLTPALLRMPFALLGVRFGRLSRSLMLADYAGALLSAYLILIWATRRVSPARAWPRPGVTIVFTANVGLGSTLLFLASRAYIYHEAILCGAAFALAGAYCTLRYLAEPDRRWWLGALACGLLSVQARPPAGLFALAFTGSVALTHLSGGRARFAPGGARRFLRDALVGVGCVLGILSFNAVGYLKFHTFDGAPLQYHVQYSPERLARFDGRNFHWANVPFNFEAYLVRPTFEFHPRFPYLSAGARSPDDDHRGPLKLDLVEPMLGLPYAMPGLCLLALIGGTAAWRRHPALRKPLLALGLAALPFALIMFMAVATSHRYTGDFCPFLVTAAALGAAALGAAEERGRTTLAALVTAATAASLLITLALAWDYQVNEVWGVPSSARRRFRRFGSRVDQALFARLLRPAGASGNGSDQADLPPPRILGFSCHAWVGSEGDPLVAGMVINAQDPQIVRLRLTGQDGEAIAPDPLLSTPHLNLIAGPKATGAASPLETTVTAGAYTLQIARPGEVGLAVEESAEREAEEDEDLPFLANFSSRGPVEENDRPLTLQFTVSGAGEKEVLIRALGPSLARFGVLRPLPRPKLEVFQGSTLVMSNVHWDGSPAAAEQVIQAEATAQVPRMDPASHEAALVLPLTAGSYTLRVTGPPRAGGVALIEVYELEPP